MQPEQVYSIIGNSSSWEGGVMMTRILMVEDDRIIASGLEYSLTEEGYEAVWCANVQAAREALAGQEIDLCLIDLTLPDGSGYEVCRLAKEKGDIPVVFLTACDDEVNVVMGLDMGADDYVTKPFRLRELMSRIKSVLRRYGKAGASSPVLTFGNLRINTMEAKVYKEDEEVFLTALEYRQYPGPLLQKKDSSRRLHFPPGKPHKSLSRPQ